MGPSKGVLAININYDKALKFTTSILLTIQFESGLGVVDLKWLSSSAFTSGTLVAQSLMQL